MKRAVTCFALGVTALALSNCARHPAPVDPSSVGAKPVTLSHEAVQQQEPNLTAWGHFSRGVRGLDDPFDLTRDPDAKGDDPFTSKEIRQLCDEVMPDPKTEDMRQKINAGYDGLDTGLTILDVAGAVAAPPAFIVKAGVNVVGGIGGAAIADIGHYVFQKKTDQEGSRLLTCLGDVAENTVTLPWHAAKAIGGVISGTGSAIASLFSSDEAPKEEVVAQAEPAPPSESAPTSEPAQPKPREGASSGRHRMKILTAEAEIISGGQQVTSPKAAPPVRKASSGRDAVM